VNICGRDLALNETSKSAIVVLPDIIGFQSERGVGAQDGTIIKPGNKILGTGLHSIQLDSDTSGRNAK
jgi:hypothetical protein